MTGPNVTNFDPTTAAGNVPGTEQALPVPLIDAVGVQQVAETPSAVQDVQHPASNPNGIESNPYYHQRLPRDHFLKVAARRTATINTSPLGSIA